MTALNVDLLKQVKERILADPDHFYMDVFIIKSPSNCGTVACIAGHIALMSNPDREFRTEQEFCLAVQVAAVKALLNFPNEEEASDWLHGKRIRLFFVREWPSYLQDKYDKAATKKEEAEVACKAIDYFIKYPERIYGFTLCA